VSLAVFVGHLELAGELGIQVTAAVDVADEVGLGLGGTGGGGLSFFRGGAERGQFRASRLERPALAFELGDGLGVRLDAVAIQLGQRRHCARGLSQTSKVGSRQQQPQISCLAELVDFDETLVELGDLGLSRSPEGVHPGARPAELGLHTRGIRVDALELFRLYLPLHLELAQVAEQRPLVGCQSIRLALERLQPIGGAPRHRLGPRALGQRLSETGRNRRDRKDRGDKRRENNSLRSPRA
jgi:hypothetical protein